MKKKKDFIFTLLCIVLIIIIILIVFNIFKIYNSTKNINLLSEYIIKNNELYNDNNTYICKGNVTNNYVKFNNLTWRIIKINNDSSITLILDDYINMLPKNLVNTFFKNLENNLDTNYLTKTKVCIDTYTNNEITCNKTNKDNYITLLSVYDYINSLDDEKTFITKDNEIMWLYNDLNHTNGNNISTSNENNFYEIRPVVTLKPDTTYKSGNGNIDNPYIINEDKLSIGSKVKLGNDTYIVYDLKDNIKLMSTKTLNNLLIENVLDYLNNEFFEKLDYKDLLQDTTIYTGDYNNRENDLTKEKITKKIGIPNILDIKFDNEVTNYYLPNKINTFALIYNNPIIYGDAKKEHETRYTITLSKDIIKNLIKENDTYIYGDGAK